MKDVPGLPLALADRLSEGVIVANEAGLLYVNPSGLTLLGADRSEEVIGKPLSLFLRSGTISDILRQADLQRQDDRAVTVAGQLLRVDGSTVAARLSSLPILWEGAASWILVIEPETARFDATDRTLAEAYRRASSKMETIGMLAAGFVHEVNNTLTAVLGFGQLALMQIPADNKAHRHVQRVIDAGRKSSELISQMLMFCRRSSETRHPLSLHVLVSESLAVLRSAIPSWIDMRERVAKETSPIEADAAQMRQMFVSVIADAVHAMRHAGGVLDIELQDEELSADRVARYGRITPGRYVCLRVKDSGEVTAQEAVTCVLDPLSTANAHGVERVMGLSVVQGIVSAHGGTVLVESEPGLGTTVSIIFPTPMAQASLVSTNGKALSPSHDVSRPLIEESNAVGPRD